MKVLYFAPHPCWPLTSGARLRNYHLARELALRESVTFLGLRNPDEEPADQPENIALQRYVTFTRERGYTPLKLVKGLLGPDPVTVLNYTSRRVASELAELLEEGRFDLVQVEGVHLLKYVSVIRSARSRPVIMADWHNIESELMWRYSAMAPNLARRMAARRTARLIEGAERRLLGACAAHSVASERERNSLAKRAPQANLHVVPNGVDVGHYDSEGRPPAEGGGIIFVGSMDYHANSDAAIWFVREIWPALLRKHPKLRFTIVGRDPSQAVLALASDSVHVTGTVPDVRPFYAGALAVVVPVRVGSGTRLKILEAMAAGIPVVSTALGAEGIEIERDRNILIADTAEAFIDCTRRIVSSQEVRRGLSAAGRELVGGRYDWSIIGRRLHEIHRGLLEQRSR